MLYILTKKVKNIQNQVERQLYTVFLRQNNTHDILFSRKTAFCLQPLAYQPTHLPLLHCRHPPLPPYLPLILCQHLYQLKTVMDNCENKASFSEISFPLCFFFFNQMWIAVWILCVQQLSSCDDSLGPGHFKALYRNLNSKEQTTIGENLQQHLTLKNKARSYACL